MSNILIFVILSANHASEETTLVMVCFTKNRKIANFEYFHAFFDFFSHDNELKMT